MFSPFCRQVLITAKYAKDCQSHSVAKSVIDCVDPAVIVVVPLRSSNAGCGNRSSRDHEISCCRVPRSIGTRRQWISAISRERVMLFLLQINFRTNCSVGLFTSDTSCENIISHAVTNVTNTHSISAFKYSS